MSPALQAHLRLLTKIPRERICTHRQAEPVLESGGGRSRTQTKHLHQRIKDLERRGFANHEIADELEISRTTVSKHLNGHIRMNKGGDQRRHRR